MTSYHRLFVFFISICSIGIASQFSTMAQVMPLPIWRPSPIYPKRFICRLQASPSKTVYSRGEQVKVIATLNEYRWVREPRNEYPHALVRPVNGITIFLYEISSVGTAKLRRFVGEGVTDSMGRCSIKYTVAVDQRKQGIILCAETVLVKPSDFPVVKIPTTR